MPFPIIAEHSWRTTFPGAMVGLLAMQGVSNTHRDADLEETVRLLRDRISTSFSVTDRTQLRELPTLRAYAEYYKRFGKSYHVQLQLESVLFKGKPITGPSALVQAMVMAELKNMLLTAGHDMGQVKGGLTIRASLGGERYTLLSGKEQVLKAADMYICDQEGILSSIIYGPDQRTRIRPETQAVIFTVYAPPGIRRDELDAHLSDLESNVRLFFSRCKS